MYPYDKINLKYVKQKLLMLRNFINCVYKAAEIFHILHLFVRYWTPPKIPLLV